MRAQIKEDYKPGELGFDPLGLFPTDEAAAKELQTKELNNGRVRRPRGRARGARARSRGRARVG